MKTFGLTLVVLGLCLAAIPASAQGSQTAFTFKTAENKYWQVDGFTGNNPTLNVPASTEITVTAVNADGGVHNLKIGDGAENDLDTPDQEIEVKFTSPASGTVPYVCTIHASTMKGVFQVGGGSSTTTTPAGNGGETESNDSPGFGLLGALLALAGLALVVSRRK